MITVEARIPAAARLDRKLAELGRRGPLAVSRAQNRTISSLQTAAVRHIARDLKIAQKDVRAGLAIERATPASLRARLFASARRIPLYAFRARQTRPGVSYDLGRGRQVAAGSFIARMRSGHIGVFRRVGRARLPVVELFGPSYARVFTAARAVAQWSGLIRDLMRKNLAHELDVIVRGIR